MNEAKTKYKPIVRNAFVVGSNGKSTEEKRLPCEAIAAASGEEMVKQFFGPVCQSLMKRYGKRCHKICRLFESDYRRLCLSYNPGAEQAIRAMDEQLIVIKDSDVSAIMMNIRNQAQIMEIDSQYNVHWTRVNMKFGKHHKVTPGELAENFFKYEAPKDFPVRWKKMLEEMRANENRYYAWEKFHDREPGTDPEMKELFWTYRFGRAIELFGKNHPKLFRAGHE